MAVATECGFSKTQILGALATDLPIVFKEIGMTVAVNASQLGGEYIKNKIDAAVADIAKNGLGNFKTVLSGLWKQMGEDYDAGIHAQKTASRKK